MFEVVPIRYGDKPYADRSFKGKLLLLLKGPARNEGRIYSRRLLKKCIAALVKGKVEKVSFDEDWKGH